MPFYGILASLQIKSFPEVYNPYLDLASYLQPSIIVSGLWVILFFLTGLTETGTRSRLDELFVVARTVFIGLFLLFLSPVPHR